MDARTEAMLRNAGIRPENLPPGTLIGGRPIDAAEKMAQPKSPYAPYKSKLELLWALELEAQKKGGKIIQWLYEPCSLVIADAAGVRAKYTPDFLAVRSGYGGQPAFTWFEAKGFCREAARIRFLAAKERYPFWDFRIVRRDWKTGRWIITETP